MAERKFDYAGVAEKHGEMNTAIGNIRDILVNINNEYCSKVNVEDEAIFGDLGSQLLMDWENVSSNFPSFYEKFNTWSAAVASTSGEYSDFEKRFSGFKGQVSEAVTGNPYGIGSGTVYSPVPDTKDSPNNSYKTNESAQGLGGKGRENNYVSGNAYSVFGKEYLDKYNNGELTQLEETGADISTTSPVNITSDDPTRPLSTETPATSDSTETEDK